MIHLTPAAIAEVNRIRAKQSNPNAVVRLGVKSGGCAAFYYTIELTEAIEPNDQVQSCDNIQVAIDPDSWSYLEGLKLDYTEDLMGGGFRFDNPNAVSSCGCGNSFAVHQTSLK